MRLIKFLLKAIVALVVLFIIILILSALSGKKSTQNTTTKNGGSKTTTTSTVTPPGGETTKSGSYLLGIGYSHFNTVPGLAQSVSEIKKVSDIIYIQHPWQESVSNPDFFTSLNNEVSEARRQGLKIYIAIEVFNADRSAVDLPSNLSGNLGTPAVQDAYIAYVKKIASTYKPDYLMLNVEANILKQNDAGAYAPYPALYAKAYDAAKSASGNTKVGVSIALFNKDSSGCFTSSDFSRFQSDAQDFSKGDFLAISYYPMCYLDPKLFPESFLSNIAQVSNKPLFVSETGWMSEGLSGIGSEANQTAYIDSLARSADYAVKQGAKIDAINYVTLSDPSKQMCDYIVSVLPSLSWYCRLGLLHLDGSEKPAYTEFGVWHAKL